MIFDLQLNPATESWGSLRDGVQLADEAGYNTIWVFDHFAGNLLRGTTMIECFTLLGTYAALTTRIGLGSLVVNVANRPPGVMISAAASVQTVSGGRLRLGVGAGAAPGTQWSAEHRLFGIDLPARMVARHARLEHALDLMDRMWAPDRDAAFETFALPSPRPPVIVGVNSLRLAELAGRRCDGLNVRASKEQVGELFTAARRAREQSPLAGQPFECSVWTPFDEALRDPEHPRRREWEALGVDRLILTCLDPYDAGAVSRFLR